MRREPREGIEVPKVTSAAQSPASRKARTPVLEWIARAKRPETRQCRIATTVEPARENVRAARPKAA
ncbi:YdeI/OmpD-associated family protein [Amycolatopsis sp. NPDC049252]|uniref:YdeI/OmpD-associated family protein n=1 Tax=Amycolatopsis sp. NPDC049252 TaxID=3363933 RepID=UPI00371D601C